MQSKPQQGETRRNPRDEISGNRKSQKRSELAPNGINFEVPVEKFQWRFKLAPKGINSEAPAKTKRNPWEGISRYFHSQGRFDLAPKGNKFWGAWRINCYVVYNFHVDPSWRKKEITPKRRPENFVPAGQFLRSVQLPSRSKLTR